MINSSIEKDILQLAEQAEKRERNVRRRTILYSLIPVVLALLLLGIISVQIRNATLQLSQTSSELQQADMQVSRVRSELEEKNRQLSETQRDLEKAQAQLNQTNEELSHSQNEVKELQEKVELLTKELGEVTDQLKYATDFKKYEFSGDLPLTIKHLCTTYNDECGLLLDIAFLYHGNIGWKLNGTSPDEGFDSPGFAAYILNEYKEQGSISPTMPHIPPTATQGDIQKLLNVTLQPKIGDVVYYEAGYTMFYFENEKGDPFVIGMTPLGILALKADFAKIRGYSRVLYTRM